MQEGISRTQRLSVQDNFRCSIFHTFIFYSILRLLTFDNCEEMMMKHLNLLPRGSRQVSQSLTLTLSLMKKSFDV